ncbi:hypothetical protein OJ633_001902 [Listeria monocytogenes]|nr:hypothetical protein [Listeria monocytogenes]EKA2554069.1 hypothetical protein [Listeria monocytogenes]EKA2557651.1 hypothetical protein [Listeria monocytogenes]EKA2560775.1 hypothetical protein [Listeria monocytogenes]EKA2563943.1 hypothetical protein [Listeria monocytogenes]
MEPKSIKEINADYFENVEGGKRMKQKIYALYVEEGQYLCELPQGFEWARKFGMIRTSNDISEAIKFTSFEEADKEASKSNLAMVVEVTNLKRQIDC